MLAWRCQIKPRRAQNALELKEKQLSDGKKILLSAKQSYDKTVCWKQRP